MNWSSRRRFTPASTGAVAFESHVRQTEQNPSASSKSLLAITLDEVMVLDLPDRQVWLSYCEL